MKKNTSYIAILLSILIGAYLINEKRSSTSYKIGVIQMEKLVYDYQGMKEATKKYNTKMDLWSNQADSIETNLKQLYNQVRLDSINGNQEEIMKNQQRFYLVQRSYYEFKQNIDQKAQEEDQKMTIGVINQLKEHIKAYAQQEGYQLIISNTQLQNVGYVEAEIDVTDELLIFANTSYQGNE